MSGAFCALGPFLREQAALDIQRFYRGAVVRYFHPRRQQLDINPLGHISINAWTIFGLDDLNNEHELWGTLHEGLVRGPSKVWFSGADIICEDGEIRRGCTNTLDREKRPTFRFAKILNASFEGKPLYPLVTKDKYQMKSIDILFKRATASLERGNKYTLWDGRSTNIPASGGYLLKVKTTHLKFRYLSGLGPIPPVVVDVSDLEERLAAIMKTPVGPCSVVPKPLLARSAPRTICGVRSVPYTDELDKRMQRLLNLNL